LDNVRSLLSIEVCIRYNFFDLRKFPTYLYTASSIGVFARLDYPNLLAQLLKCSLCFARIIIFEEFCEPEILLVTGSLLDVECERKDTEPVLADRFIVNFHVVI
jgi:hypothetical protein